MIQQLRIDDVNTTKRIKALLALRGETTIDLAMRLGVSQPTLSYRLTGRRSFDGRCGLDRIAAALDVPISTVAVGAPWPDITAKAPTHH